MSLFDSIKSILGVKAPDKIETVEAVEKIKSATTVTKPVTVKPKKTDAPKVKRETRKSLDKLTKKAIDDLALERFGAELDRRKTKEKMIEDFMAAQKKAG